MTDLVVETGPTAYPLVAPLAAAWNRNPPPGEGTVGWDGPAGGTDERLADAFAVRYGVEPTRRDDPPFAVDVRLSSSVEALRGVTGVSSYGAADVGGVLGEAWLDLPDDEVASIRPQAVARAGVGFVVGAGVAEVVPALTPDEIRSIYAGETTTWRAVGGPNRPIRVVSGGEASGNTVLGAFLGDAGQAGVDDRAAGVAERVRLVDGRDDAIRDLPAGAVANARDDARRDAGGDAVATADGVTPLGTVIDGRAPFPWDPASPTTEAVHLVTEGTPDDRESAFVDAALSAFAHETFVRPATGLVVPAGARDDGDG